LKEDAALYDLYGPFINIATLCEEVRREPDGSISLLRIVQLLPAGPEDVQLIAVIALQSGIAIGDYDVRLTISFPWGEEGPGPETSVVLAGDEQGHTVYAPLTFPGLEPGIYWVNVHLGQRLVTRIPLRVAAPDMG
jgi:hypothetical protein